MNVAMTEMQKVKRVLFVAPTARHSRTTGKLQVHVHCNQSNNWVTAELTKQAHTTIHYYSLILLMHLHFVGVIQEDYHPLQRYKRLNFLRYCCSSWLEHFSVMAFQPNEMSSDMLLQYIMSEHQFNTFRRMWTYKIRGFCTKCLNSDPLTPVM